jgi:hypothetical protein
MWDKQANISTSKHLVVIGVGQARQEKNKIEENKSNEVCTATNQGLNPN